jgi:multidrug efflux system membrane fusion protein
VYRLCVAAVALALSGGCGGESPSPGGAASGGGRRPTQFPVEVRRVEARTVQYRIDAVGSIEAFEIVQVTARVPGVIEAVRFVEGDRVERGAVLVEVEPERYRLAVESARATLEKATAARAEAAAGLERREGATARQPGVIPAEEIEAWRTRVRTAEADQLQAQAALEQAELNHRDAHVRAPVSGTVQTRNVQTGAYVQPGAALATMLRRDPLLVRFTIPATEAGRVQPGMIAEFTVRESQRRHAARIVHVAASADPATRMVAVTGHVDTSGGDAPRPGAFAEVVIPIGSAVGAAVIPETAVRPSERGFLAYTIRDGKARERVLELGMRTADGLVEVRAGIAPGDSLVVRGAEALRDGAAVRVVAAREDSTAAGAAAGRNRTAGRP